MPFIYMRKKIRSEQGKERYSWHKSRGKISDQNLRTRTITFYHGNCIRELFPWIFILIRQNLHMEGWRTVKGCKGTTRIRTLETTNIVHKTVHLPIAIRFPKVVMCSCHNTWIDAEVFHTAKAAFSLPHGVGRP